MNLLFEFGISQSHQYSNTVNDEEKSLSEHTLTEVQRRSFLVEWLDGTAQFKEFLSLETFFAGSLKCDVHGRSEIFAEADVVGDLCATFFGKIIFITNTKGAFLWAFFPWTIQGKKSKNIFTELCKPFVAKCEMNQRPKPMDFNINKDTLVLVLDKAIPHFDVRRMPYLKQRITTSRPSTVLINPWDLSNIKISDSEKNQHETEMEAAQKRVGDLDMIVRNRCQLKADFEEYEDLKAYAFKRGV